MSRTYRNIRYREAHIHPKTFNQVKENSKFRFDLKDNNLHVNVRHNAKCKNSLTYLPSAYDDIKHSSNFGKNKLNGNLLIKEQIYYYSEYIDILNRCVKYKFTKVHSFRYYSGCKTYNRRYEINVNRLLNRNWITFMDIPTLFKAYEFALNKVKKFPIWINFKGIHINKNKVLTKFTKTLIEYINENGINLIFINVNRKIKRYFKKHNDNRIYLR